ncbi:uncharacterized protein Fot_42212 [Forsythia ovata]|uniref:Uncharacterized protein n=1 Tax=Forsythia ovata TaxID=205694 RepID=A0ABD1RKI5_9LAMI
MGSVSVLVYYDGDWDEAHTYNDYLAVLIIVPLECTYVNLVGMIMKELKNDDSEDAITIQYQVLANGPLIWTCNDSSLSFYIHVKKNECDLTKFPLCVDLEKVKGSGDNLGYLCNSISETYTEGFRKTSIA